MDLWSDDAAKVIVAYVKENNDRLLTNEKLFNIHEGEIGKLMREKIKKDLGDDSFAELLERVVPVNTLIQIVDKLSKIYQSEPKRTVSNKNPGKAKKDQVILDSFAKMMSINTKMNTNNEFSNLYKSALMQIANKKNKPFAKTIANHQFLVMNLNPIDPAEADIVILLMGMGKDKNGDPVNIYWAYSDDQFAIYDSKSEFRPDLLSAMGQDGTIPTGQKPFVYLNKSKNLVMPAVQSDTLDMTLLIPLLFTDNSYIAKFTAFSIMYGIDIKKKERPMSPNMFWHLQSDTDSDKNPQVGTIKPEGDIQKLLSFIFAVIDVWLSTKGIKAGAIGSLTAETAASGISKMIDLADVTDERELQTTLYADFEKEFWDLLLKKYYPFWVEQGLMDNIGTFSEDSSVLVEFPPQRALVDRGNQVDTLDKEVTAGFTSRKRAIQMLNPRMTASEVDELIDEIDEENDIEVVEDESAKE
jgi:hypothetical protein